MKALIGLALAIALRIAAKRAADRVLSENDASEDASFSVKEGADVSPQMRDIVSSVASETGIPIVITSGLRSATSQASAMLSKVKRGEDIRALYRSNADIIDKLLAGPRDTASWAAIIQGYANAGRYLSDHLRIVDGIHAIDIRTRDRSEDEVQAMLTAFEERGLRGLVESDHLHIEP